jgi:hypothetical protein
MKRQQKWNLKDGVAVLDWPNFHLRVDASTPELGGAASFSKVTPDSDAGKTLAAGPSGFDAALFQVRNSADQPNGDATESVETYCRGGDLISRYAADSKDSISREIYWRLVTDAVELSDQIASVEMIYSLQTDLLDSAPQPSVPSTFSNASTRWFQSHQGSDDAADPQWNECDWEAACFAAGEGDGRVACVIGFPGGSSLLQTVYPPDLRGVEMNSVEQQTEIHWQLRSDFLEKGVIRRLRLLTVIGGEDASEKDLLGAASHFYRSELPLTV